MMTADYANELLSQLRSNIGNIPPSERAPFIEAQKILNSITAKSDKEVLGYMCVLNLNKPSDAFFFEWITRQPGCKQTITLAQHWTAKGELMYAATFHLVPDLYYSLRRKKTRKEKVTDFKNKIKGFFSGIWKKLVNRNS